MNASQHSAHESVAEASQFERFVYLLYVRRWWLVAFVAFCTVGMTVLAFTVEPVYRARAVLMPSDRMNGAAGDLSSLSVQFGGLASLAGLDLMRPGSSVEAVATLKSQQFTEEFIREKNLLPRLFRKQWDAESGTWKASVKRPPTLRDAYKLFDRKIRRVTEDKKTGLVILEIDWIDRNEAAAWANELTKRANDKLRERSIAEASKMIKYLEQELQKTNVVAVEQAIFKLTDASVKQRTLANVQEEYAFKVLDPAVPPDEKDPIKPQKFVYLATGPLIGILVGLLVIISVEFGRILSFGVRRQQEAQLDECRGSVNLP